MFSPDPGSSYFKPWQTFEHAAFFQLINHLPVHSIKAAHTDSVCRHQRVCTYSSPGCRNLGRSPLTDSQRDQREVNDEEGGRAKKGGGLTDNSQINVRIQVFGFATQLLHSLWHLIA